MKSQIDQLVRSIHQHLVLPSPSEPLLAGLIAAVGVDGVSQAIAQRDVLERWAHDGCIPQAIRAYAKEQLDALPSF